MQHVVPHRRSDTLTDEDTCGGVACVLYRTHSYQDTVTIQHQVANEQNQYAGARRSATTLLGDQHGGRTETPPQAASPITVNQTHLRPQYHLSFAIGSGKQTSFRDHYRVS